MKGIFCVYGGRWFVDEQKFEYGCMDIIAVEGEKLWVLNFTGW